MFNSYDGVPYPGHPYPQSYPDRLATLGLLFGLRPADVEHCRVLELACGDAANLIPLAFSLPQSTFTGCDLSVSAIRSGKAMASALGLQNITLHHMDLRGIDRTFGQFDYIIAHGVYSWVPPDIRDKILSICKTNLARNGIAYISYNAYPGGHLRDMVSGMMKFHVQGCSNAAEKISQSRSLMKFLADANAGHGQYGDFLQHEFERVQTSDDVLIYHDDLCEFRAPVFFYQFIEDAARHGLQFLAEADFNEMQDSIYPPAVTEKLTQLNHNIVLKEQYLDFLKCRTFRQTLLIHQEITINRVPNAAAIVHFRVASRAQPVSAKPDLSSNVIEEFKGPRGGAAKTDHCLTKAALVHLAKQWPRAEQFKCLYAEARTMVANGEDHGPAELCGILLQLYSAGVIEFHVHVPAFTIEVSERPTASPLARLQAPNSKFVTALNYASVKLDDSLSQNLLRLLDGTRDRVALKNDLELLIRTGEATVLFGGKTVQDRSSVVEIMSNQLEQNLERFAHFALLIN